MTIRASLSTSGSFFPLKGRITPSLFLGLASNMNICPLSNYSGSGFTVGRFALFIFLKIGNESTNSSTGASRQFVSIIKFAGRYVLFVQGYIKLALTSVQDRLAYLKNRMNSGFVSESKPSAILCIDDPAASCICFFNP